MLLSYLHFGASSSSRTCVAEAYLRLAYTAASTIFVVAIATRYASYRLVLLIMFYARCEDVAEASRKASPSSSAFVAGGRRPICAKRPKYFRVGKSRRNLPSRNGFGLSRPQPRRPKKAYYVRHCPCWDRGTHLGRRNRTYFIPVQGSRSVQGIYLLANFPARASLCNCTTLARLRGGHPPRCSRSALGPIGSNYLRKHRG